MQVTELSGARLDYWVAKAEGIEVKYSAVKEHWHVMDEPEEIQWLPHQDWAQAGPIIEREGIGFFRAETPGPEYGEEAWVASDVHDSCTHRGRTPLIAAMRAYVASKFGEQVPER
jgi:hypothetical protein